MGHVLRKIHKYLTTRNAGILFYHVGGDGTEVLLARRSSSRGRGLWGGSGGSASRVDRGDLWRTAVRETLEEFGDHMAFRDDRARFLQQSTKPLFWDVRPPLYHFRIYAVELDAKPSLSQWPSRNQSSAPDCWEWTDAQWFSVESLPPVCERLPGLWTLGLRLPWELAEPDVRLKTNRNH